MPHSNTPILGSKIPQDYTANRDAVHVAVAPVEAGENLKPGEHVGLGFDGRIYGSMAECPASSSKPIGIVDPFLSPAMVVSKGERCYIMLYPNTVHSLRHEWSHTAFTVADEFKGIAERHTARLTS